MTHHPSPVAVIGAGMIGAAVAQRLAEKGVAVCCSIGPSREAARQPPRTRWVNANEKLPRAYFDLSVAAMEDYRRLAWRLAPAPWYHRRRQPHLVSRSRQSLRAAGECATAPSVGLRGGDAAGAGRPGRSRTGVGNPRSRDAGRLVLKEAWVDAPAMTRRLVEAARNAGGRVLTGPDREVVAIGREGEPDLLGDTARGPDAPGRCRGQCRRSGRRPRCGAWWDEDLPVLAPRRLAVRAELPDGGDPAPPACPNRTVSPCAPMDPAASFSYSPSTPGRARRQAAWTCPA